MFEDLAQGAKRRETAKVSDNNPWHKVLIGIKSDCQLLCLLQSLRTS